MDQEVVRKFSRRVVTSFGLKRIFAANFFALVSMFCNKLENKLR
jgi:hypothetical protein